MQKRSNKAQFSYEFKKKVVELLETRKKLRIAVEHRAEIQAKYESSAALLERKEEELKTNRVLLAAEKYKRAKAEAKLEESGKLLADKIAELESNEKHAVSSTAS